jgi:ribonuclease HII
MKYPNLREEKKLWKRGFEVVVGLDEAGRGALSGPVIVAAVSINPRFQTPTYKKIPNSKYQVPNKKFWLLENGNLFGIWNLEFGNLKIRDSKKLTPKQREKLYKLITKSSFIKWGIGKVSEKVIDKINIFEATKLAMKRAIQNLSEKLKNENRRINFLILDGNFSIDVSIPQKSIVKADEKILSCAMASIIAKVVRDRIMEKYAKKFPQYGFEKHKGYGTKFHLEMLKKYGPCKIHRKSFSPIAKI